MNDPSTKYANATQEPLTYFNYHEYLTDKYTPAHNPTKTKHRLDDASSISSHQSKQKVSLVINHFPNPYTTKGSALYHTTRIVRIPRIFDTVEHLYMVPQFSTWAPGAEPAAIHYGKENGFVSLASYDGTVFGPTSVTPLVPGYLSANELREIVDRLNEFLLQAMSPNKTTTFENIVEFFTGTLYSRIFAGKAGATHLKKGIARMEEYVEQLNRNFLSKRHELLRLISPVDSAFLSLDFQIPKPPATTEYELRQDDTSQEDLPKV